MHDDKHRINSIAYIAIGIAAMLVGGAAIYQMTAVFPIPGFKYIVMAPYLSLVIYILLIKVGSRAAMFQIGLLFAIIMTFVNVFMGIAIGLTTLLTHLSVVMITDFRMRAVLGSVLFSGYTGISSLLISKYMIGGIFESIDLGWIMVSGLLCITFGIVGMLTAKRLMVHINAGTRHV